MKIILLQDVKGTGKKGEIVEVNDGYATNFLMPKKMAVMVSKTSLEIKKNQEAEKARQEEERRQKALELKEKLKGITLVIPVSVGKEKKLFGAISTKTIQDEYKKQHNIEIDKRKIIDTGPITTLGYTKLNIELYKGVIGTLSIEVIEK